MRRYLLYVSTIVLAVITVAYLAIGLGERRPLYPRIFPFENARRAQDFLDSLQEAHIPVTEINLSALYSENGQFQILHPLLWMNDLHQKTQIAACSKMESAVLKSARPTFACEDKPSILNEANAAQATKQHLYERILNNESRPTDEFIRTPPFIAPDGNSYAYLLTTNGVAPFHSSEWIRSHLSFFKTTELKEILLSHRIENRAFRTLSQLSELEVNALVEGLPLVITPHTLLLKNQDRLGFSPLSYRVYSIQDVKSRLDEKADDFNSDQTYDLIPFTTSTFCLERIGNGCWTYGANTAMSYLNRYAAAVLVLITSGILIFTTMYLKRAHERNRDRERYRIALQVLSHEFRTPVSVMILLLDQLTRAVSRVDEAKQDIITRFSGEVYRLQRVIEMSKTYLQSSSRATRFNWVKIPSLNDWLMEFCEESNLHLKYEVLTRDQAIFADPFWLRFVLNNLVQNAFAHGQAPVRIRLSESGEKIRITVEDQGSCEFDSIKTMSEAFVKSQKSQGMGLGLNIASTILAEWGSRLEFKPHPTSFAIVLRPCPPSQ